MNDQSNPSQRRVWRARGLLALLLLAGAVFLLRGPLRAMDADRGGADLQVIVAAVRGFAQGINPYNADALAPLWPQRGSESGVPGWRGSEDLLYPPSTLVILWPLGLIGWGAARTLWVGLSVLALLAGVASLWRLMSIERAGPGRALLAIAALVLAPVHTALLTGQTSVVTFGLVASAHAARIAGSPWLSGVLIGLGSAIKPQIGLVFLAYELFRLRWKAGLTGLGVAAAAFGIGSARLSAMDIDWIADLRSNLHQFETIGRGDPTMANEMRYQLLNLHVPLHVLIESRAVVTVLVWTGVLALALTFLAFWLRRREGRDELLALSMACPLALLLVYHRTYDAVIVLITIAWALRELVRANDRRARTIGPPIAALICCAPFALPSNSILFALQQRGYMPGWLADSLVYDLILEPHQIWALVALSIVLIVALALRDPAPLAWRRRESFSPQAGDRAGTTESAPPGVTPAPASAATPARPAAR